MKTITTIAVLLIILLGLMAFNSKINTKLIFEKLKFNITTDVLNAEIQSELQPEEIVLALKEGNQRFMNNETLKFNNVAQIVKSKDQQFPKAFILSCIDSRVPVERVFDRGIGDLLVGRVAGNLINEDILGSMEYACKVAGAKVIVVLGHEGCTTIQHAIEGLEMGNMTNLLAKIQPSITKATYTGNTSASNLEYVNHVSKNNIFHSIEMIRQESVIIDKMVRNKEVELVPAIYNMETGEVEFL